MGRQIADHAPITPEPPHPVLTFCDDEPIQTPGAIQPHGILFAASPGDLRITAVSANAGRYCGNDARTLLDRPLADVLSAASYQALADARRPGADGALKISRLTFTASPTVCWRGIIHADARTVLLEAECATPDTETDPIDHFEHFHTASRRIMASGDAPTTYRCLVEEIRRLVGYSRVMLYRFAPDWSGEVIAEASDGQMPSYLGLHFPASDIPAQARALYARTAERQIPNVGYQPVPLLQTAGTPIDLSHCGLRSVSPIHLAYLRNMAVGAAMSVSVLQNGRLWGLVACHHPTGRTISVELRQSCVLLSQYAATRSRLFEEAVAASRHTAVISAAANLLRDVGEDADDDDVLLPKDVLQRNSRMMLELLGASGVIVSCGGQTTVLGDVPAGLALDGLLAWLDSRRSAQPTHEPLVTDCLFELYPAAAGVGEAAGLLATALGGTPRSMIVWLRPERARSVNWAGDPVKPMQPGTDASPLTPRRSFEAWTVQVLGRSRPWTEIDIAAANSLRDALIGIIVRRAAVIQQRTNVRLLRSNEELESFAYLASHDLQEPLRQIEIFGSLLQRAFARTGDPPEKIERWFNGIATSSRRLRNLIDHLANYARLGSEIRAPVPTDLNDIVAAVLQDFAGQIAQAGGSIAVSALPVVAGDTIQLRRVFQNLIGNAIKYRHSDRPLTLRIAAEQPATPALPRTPADPPMIAVRVADNGIGFDQRHSEQIFRPFERLHSTDDYEGSGLGLAICRKIVERHGGAITASGTLDVGAVFTVTLPLVSIPPGKTSSP